jgi:hypothetical protein
MKVGSTKGHVSLATPEKALLDVLYLKNTQSRFFAHLPELARGTATL